MLDKLLAILQKHFPCYSSDIISHLRWFRYRIQFPAVFGIIGINIFGMATGVVFPFL